MPKRSPDTSSSDVGRSSESDVKPADQHDPSSEDENETPKKKPRKSPKSPKKDNLDGGDKICGKWTQEEDAILFDVIGDKIWKMIKEDGRLVYRGSPSVKGHWTAIKRSMKIGESSGK